jgi:hypothetical protein
MKHTASVISEFIAMLFIIPLTCALSAIGILACEIFPLERGLWNAAHTICTGTN